MHTSKILVVMSRPFPNALASPVSDKVMLKSITCFHSPLNLPVATGGLVDTAEVRAVQVSASSGVVYSQLDSTSSDGSML